MSSSFRITDEPASDIFTTDFGVVIKKTISSYDVYIDGRNLTCSLSTQLLKAAAGRTNSGRHKHSSRADTEHSAPVFIPAVGDQVRVQSLAGNDHQIIEVLPRRNHLARRSAVPMPTAHAHEQIIAANVDQVVPVFAAAQPAPKWPMLDRYLVSAESASISALICINKIDLVRLPDGSLDEGIQAAADEYKRIGYQVVLVSAVTGEGLDQLSRLLHGRISVFLGKSGVGKTSLLNALQPELGLRVNYVSQATGKGKHTTTHLEMFPLGEDGWIADTPGVREFGLWEVDGSSLAMLFPEMRPFVGKCRFGLDCSHNEEPGCAVRQAVTAGKISHLRYNSYLKLREEA